MQRMRIRCGCGEIPLFLYIQTFSSIRNMKRITTILNIRMPYAGLMTAFLLGLLWNMTGGCGQNGGAKSGKSDALTLEDSLLQAGTAYAALGGRVLMQQLKTAMAEGGVPHAVRYCAANAYPLLDSASRAEGAVIRRVSHKPRNEKSSASPWERDLIREYQDLLDEGETLAPRLRTDTAYKIAYSPIVLNQGLCLNCHGELGTDITPENYSLIYERYDDDSATGFKIGQMRGLWRVEFPE